MSWTWLVIGRERAECDAAFATQVALNCSIGLREDRAWEQEPACAQRRSNAVVVKVM